ncbi:MAG: 16S rRNA (adenine(1518)-N(6)/adenine(1519)-N(6))-dimethyltransferase RsmA [Phycisphaerales bacterium]|nr:16S rRNA (adenine(1518)-N(6)/adenine(1519)-N(6))-dimethyltransferase RsmA [Phycisphaerales bacterium]
MRDTFETSVFHTKTRIRSLLDSAGLSPRKRFGQCFLIDRNLMEKLVDAAELGPSDCVLEVGCGTGSLTGLLAERAGCVVTVEVDDAMIRIAREQLSSYGNVRWLATDALTNKSSVAAEIESAVTEDCQRVGGALKLVANLPYDIATSLILNLLLGNLPFARFCFTVQAEVADRFLADSDAPDYGPVSIISQLLAEGQRIAKVPAKAFWPAPKVSSAMVRLDVKSQDLVDITDAPGFARFVRSFFLHRRKTMAHLVRMLKADERLVPAMADLGIPPNVRPERVTVAQWISLFKSNG